MKLFGNKKHAGHVQKRKAGGAKYGILIALCVLLVLAGTGFAVYKFNVKPTQENKKQTVIQQPLPVQTEVKAPTITKTQKQLDVKTGETVDVAVEEPAGFREGVYNILICGTDGDGYRTDTIMIAHLDTNTKQTALMSIPRDTVVETSDYIMKINSVYANGGDEGMKRLESRLNTLLGFPVDGYFLVDLEAFQKAVDLIGGVWFDVPMDMYYNDPTQNLHIDLKAGYQLLDGVNAMGLVRFRKGYASQDIQRTKVQQDFLKALAKQCLSIGNLTKLKEFADIFSEYVLTDLTVGNMLYFAKELMSCDLDEMKSYTVEGEGMMINGGSYYPLFDWSILDIVNESFNPYETKLTSENIHVVTPGAAQTYQTPAQPEETDSDEVPDETLPDDSDDTLSPEVPDETLPDENPSGGGQTPDPGTDDGSTPELPGDPEFWN